MENAPKILHIVDGLNPSLGGVAKAVEGMVKGLEECNVLTHILSLDDKNYVSFNGSNTQLFAIGRGNGPWNYNKQLKTWLKSNFKDYTAVIIHGLWLYKNFCSYRVFKKQSKAKLFVMPHGMLDPYFQHTASRKLKALRNNLYWLFIEKHIVNNATGLLFTCEEEKLLARSTFKDYKPKMEFIVSLGVEDLGHVEKIKPRQQDSPYYLYLSRIHEKKGLDLLIDAYKELLIQESGKEIPKLIIAGPGIESSFGQMIAKRVQQNSLLSKNIEFVGMVLGASKMKLINDAELFILPSHQENFGIAIAEALSCSTPVLISNKVNIWREIKEGKAGLIVTDSQSSILKALKNWFYFDKQTKDYFKVNARSTYENNFTIPAAKDKLLKALKND